MSEEYGQLEKEGYLSKKNRNGFCNSRFFQTSNDKISYWIDKASFEKGETPSMFEIKDIKEIKRASKGCALVLIFGDKFRIDLKCDYDECTTWYEVLTAKKAFYSVKELLIDLKDENINFVTKTFSSLMVIPISEQNDWIVDHLNDVFEAAADDAQTTMLRSDPMWVIKAARAVIEEFVSTCEECSLELESRNPKLSAHCRGYMHRYSEMIKGRLALELSFFMETGNKQITEMGERALCAAISLMNRMDTLRVFTFLPHDLVSSLNSCLFSVGELMSALLNLSIQRIEAWFLTVVALPPISRGGRLIEVNHVLLDVLRMIDFQVQNEYELYKGLLIKVAMSLQLNFSDQLVLIDLTEYDEAALLNHIKACHTIVDQLPSHFDIARKDEEDDSDSRSQNSQNSRNSRRENRDSNQKNKEESRRESGQKNRQESSVKNSQKSSITDSQRSSNGGRNDTRNDRNDGRNGGSDDDSDMDSINTLPPTCIKLSPAVADSVRSACFSSARAAVVQIVQRTRYSVMGLIDLCFIEAHNGSWIGGGVCKAYISRLEAWLSDLFDRIPEQYISLSRMEAARLTSRLYLKALIKHYQENKRSKFSDKGLQQVLDDMKLINSWLLELFENVPNAIEEQQLLEVLSDFICIPQGDVLQLYAQSLQVFGIRYALHMYDLLRLCLKIRRDCNTKSRKGILSLCAEFHAQLQSAVAADITHLGGARKGRTAYLSVFDDLCPRVVVEHCTGKKWSIEMMSDPIAVQTLIARFVTETCQAARKREREQWREAEEASRRETELAVSAMALTAGCPPLPPPPRPPPPPITPLLNPSTRALTPPLRRDPGLSSAPSSERGPKAPIITPFTAPLVAPVKPPRTSLGSSRGPSPSPAIVPVKVNVEVVPVAVGVSEGNPFGDSDDDEEEENREEREEKEEREDREDREEEREEEERENSEDGGTESEVEEISQLGEGSDKLEGTEDN